MQNPPRRAGWRGKLGERLQVVRHRWQRDWNGQPMSRVHNRELWRRSRLAALTLLFLGLVALFVYELWFRPIQTPLIAISAPPYAWPLPPNAWAQEDLRGLGQLDDESLRILDTSSAWRSAEGGFAALDRQLHQASKLGAKSGAVILYVSMHGAVDGDGQPALIPPGASPLHSETWLKVSDLLERIKAEHLPDAWHKLLILDCNRMEVNWNVGLLANTFADRLAEVVAAKSIPNLVVLNSTSPGETGWASADLAGSVFGHFLQLGLAGAADAVAEGGNGDHRVSLLELHQYLLKHVDGWTVANRDDHQRPMLVPESAADFTLVWSLNKRAQRRLAEATPEPTPSGAVTARDLDRLWQTHDRLAALDPVRYDPLAWADIDHKLLWLEEAITSGAAYDAPARAVLTEVKGKLTAADSRAAALGDDGGLLARASLFSDQEAKRPATAGHSLPMAQLFGVSPPEFAILTGKLTSFESAPSRPAAEQLLAGSKESEAANRLVELQFLRLMCDQLPANVWQRPTEIGLDLALQLQAERAAAPASARAQNWTSPIVAAGDRAVRQARDALFDGNPFLTADSGPLWDDAERRYGHAKRLTKNVAAALMLRDRAFAETPYLAAWLARPADGDMNRQSYDAEINDTLLPLIHTNQSLATALAQETPAVADAIADSPAFADQQEQVESRLTRLEKQLADSIHAVQNGKKRTAGSWRQLNAALATPLVTASDRQELRKTLGQIAARLNNEAAATADDKSKKSNGTTDAAKAVDEREYLLRSVTAWRENPAIAILAPGDSFLGDNAPKAGDAAAGAVETPAEKSPHAAAEKPASVADLGATSARRGHEVRDLLASLPSRLDSLHNATGSTNSSGATDFDKPISLTISDAAANQADRLARAAAGFALPELDGDPVRQLRQFNLQRLLLWQTQRVLDDFWGAAAAQSDPFFATVAADYLKAAASLGEMDPALLAERNRLAKLLELRRSAARSAVHVAAADVLLPDEVDNVTLKLGAQFTASADNHGAPTDRITLFVRDAKGRIDDTTRSIDLPTGAAQQSLDKLDLTVPRAALEGRGPMLEAVALLRTNTFATPFMLRPSGGARIDFKPYRYGPPQVTVASRSRKRASIMFILDCSNSMSEMTDIEGPGGTQHIPRLEAAKIALHEMLTQLAEEGNARVGVRIYGHRVGWNVKKPGQLLQQTEYGHPIPDGLRPSEDVELVLPLGRFDNVVAGGVFDLMKSLKPWGETPLYLSIVQAVGDFANDEPETEKSIIVITDGVNYQFNSPNPKRREDVMAAMGEHKIPVHIIGFDISAKEQAEAAKEFNGLAEQTGGSYAPVASGAGLIKSLENLLGPKTFDVFDPAGGEVGQAQVGSDVTVKPKPASPRTYTVSLGPLATGVELSGGEGVELLVSPDGKSLQSASYDRDDPRFAALMTGEAGPASPFVLGVHRPLRDTHGVHFPISVQRSDHEFAPRPLQSWIEVTPLANEKPAGAKYIFYDTNWEPGLPAPVENWLAEGWPRTADRAEVRAWIKFRATKPDWVVRLSHAANQLPANGTGASLDGLSGVTYQVRTRRGAEADSPYRVAVIERHTDDSLGLGSVKIELSPKPARIIHRFDPENHLATHIFELDDDDEQAIANYELHFTRRENVERDALQLAEPIVRPVSDTSDVIQSR